jgi:hypothetical protein
MSHAQGSHGRPGHSNMPVKNEGSHEPGHGFHCAQKQMVLDTVGLTVETTVESQFSTTVSEGDL